MFDTETKRTHLARNVKVRKKMFFRQDKSISSDQPHPFDTTFDDLIIVQDEEVTGDPHTDGVSSNPPVVATIDVSDAFSVVSSESSSSSESMSAFMRPTADPDPIVPMDDTSSDDDSDAYDWTQATASTMAETDPFGFDLADLPPQSEDYAPVDEDVIEISALPNGTPIDTSPQFYYCTPVIK